MSRSAVSVAPLAGSICTSTAEPSGSGPIPAGTKPHRLPSPVPVSSALPAVIIPIGVTASEGNDTVANSE